MCTCPTYENVCVLDHIHTCMYIFFFNFLYIVFYILFCCFPQFHSCWLLMCVWRCVYMCIYICYICVYICIHVILLSNVIMCFFLIYMFFPYIYIHLISYVIMTLGMHVHLYNFWVYVCDCNYSHMGIYDIAQQFLIFIFIHLL